MNGTVSQTFYGHTHTRVPHMQKTTTEKQVDTWAVEKHSCVSFMDMFNVEVTFCDVDEAQHVRWGH